MGLYNESLRKKFEPNNLIELPSSISNYIDWTVAVQDFNYNCMAPLRHRMSLMILSTVYLSRTTKGQHGLIFSFEVYCVTSADFVTVPIFSFSYISSLPKVFSHLIYLFSHVSVQTKWKKVCF